MKRRTLPILAALLFVAGCSQFFNAIGAKPQPTPLTRVYQLRVDYTAALKVLVQARMLGKIGDNEYRLIETRRAEAAAALDLLEASAAAGQPLDSGLIVQASLAVDSLIAAKSKYQ